MGAKMMEGTWSSSGAVTLTKEADPAVNTTADVVIAMTTNRFTGHSVCAVMDDAATNNMTELSNYTMSVSGLPTPCTAMTSDQAQMIVSVGLSTAGGLAHSSA